MPGTRATIKKDFCDNEIIEVLLALRNDSKPHFQSKVLYLSLGLKFISREFWNSVKTYLQISICRNVICHLSIMEFFIGHHIEIAGTC